MVDLGLSLSFNPTQINSPTQSIAGAGVTPPESINTHKSPSAGDGRNGERIYSRGISDEEDYESSRKKLRLTKDQSNILEETFKEHNTLSPKQKQSLAKRLRLTPRQVEVWFQNRRARTKLKQTEIDFEFLKRSCETLTEENRRLQKEIQELKALKLTNGLYMQMKITSPATTPATILNMCPSCERVTVAIPSPAPAPAPAQAASLINIWGRPLGGLCNGL
ncbi:homeobox-leucine zipper protein HAT4-like [Impatiens glandulifera]|uniref:homeobox-leucine zipper protein HAT4-like n=1 Tax=Impatiens glandulifera TaxID=253017 RepID=UPI001FB0700F|nr:homeobox-leucine zipper protein HAT4-like [Impatiens glandulifera]